MIQRTTFAVTLFLIMATLISCGKKSEPTFPNHIQTKKTQNHVRVKGTKVYGIFPDDYQHIKELARYQKNENLFIQFTESNASNFYAANPTKEGLEAKGSTIDIFKNIKLNKYDAIYLEGPSNNSKNTELGLIFGDDSFVVMIVGHCKTEDVEGKKELQEIFKSIYYDKTWQIDPFELANFEFDETITNFKYSMTVSNLFIYAENGKDDANNPIANSFQIGVFPKMTEEKAESYSNEMAWRYEQNGVTLANKTATKTTINNYTAYILESKTEYAGKSGIMYQAVLVFENTAILFMSTAYNDFDAYLEKFKKTAESIRIK